MYDNTSGVKVRSKFYGMKRNKKLSDFFLNLEKAKPVHKT